MASTGDREALTLELAALGARPALISQWAAHPRATLDDMHGTQHGFDDCVYMDADGSTIVEAVRSGAYDRVKAIMHDQDTTFSPVCWTNCAMMAVRRLDREFLEYCLCDGPLYMPCELAATLTAHYTLDDEYKSCGAEELDTLRAVLQIFANHFSLLPGGHVRDCLARHMLKWHILLGSEIATVAEWADASKQSAASLLSRAFGAGRLDVAGWVLRKRGSPPDPAWWHETLSEVAYTFGSVAVLKFFEKLLGAREPFDAQTRKNLEEGLSYAEDCRVDEVRAYLLSPECALRAYLDTPPPPPSLTQ